MVHDTRIAVYTIHQLGTVSRQRRQLTILAEVWDQRLGKGVREDKLGSDDKNLPSVESGSICIELTFGVKPLKKELIPSVLTISRMIVIPPTCELKLAF